MRIAALLALLTLSPLVAVAGGGSMREDYPDSSPAAHHVKMEVEADQLVIPLRVVLRGKDRAALDARLDALKAARSLPRSTTRTGTTSWSASTSILTWWAAWLVTGKSSR